MREISQVCKRVNGEVYEGVSEAVDWQAYALVYWQFHRYVQERVIGQVLDEINAMAYRPIHQNLKP